MHIHLANTYTLHLHSHSIDNHKTEEAKLEKANQYFREQQYKQHHHPVHVSQSKLDNSYLEALAINEEEGHDTPKKYVDTLSDAKTSTWDVYKHQLEEVKPYNEVDGKYIGQ